MESGHELEVRFTRKDGLVVCDHLVVSFVRDAEGRRQFTIGMGEDITERNRAEQSLRKSEARHRSVLDTAIDAIITLTDGRIKSFNRVAERIFGYTADEIIDRSLAVILPSHYQDVCRAARDDRSGELESYTGWRARECAVVARMARRSRSKFR